jgi:hypothetical protein
MAHPSAKRQRAVFLLSGILNRDQTVPEHQRFHGLRVGVASVHKVGGFLEVFRPKKARRQDTQKARRLFRSIGCKTACKTFQIPG